MRRRDFICELSAAALTGSTLAGLPHAAPAQTDLFPESAWRVFELLTTADIAHPVGRTRLWLPLPARQPTDYQRRLQLDWSAPGATRLELVRLPGYDVELLHVEWADPTRVHPVTLTCRVQTRDRRVELDKPERVASEPESTLRSYLRPTLLLPTDGIVRETAARITEGQVDEVGKARAIYEWVIENTNRDPRTPGCGLGDVASMLESGYLGGKCADINALFVALARAIGIPARDAYGIRIAESRLGYKSLGRTGDVSKAQHCRAEFYTRSHGWVPVDPADVRKVVLEEPPGHLPLGDPRVREARSLLFGAWEMNWVAYNHGHDVALPGSADGPLPFLMYPAGETSAGRLDPLDPPTFRYRIEARELTHAAAT